MYLQHFKLKELPFTLTPNTEFYCELPSHQEALNVLKLSLRNGEGFIKIVGEVGTGKTLLCRNLLNQIEDECVTAYIPNPDMCPMDLRKALARELGLKPRSSVEQHDLLEQITKKLLSLHEKGKPVVLIVDEAQALSDEGLETVRLLTNLETEKSKLLQVVLFGQPELNERINKRSLRQLKQRISFSYDLRPLTRSDLETYLCHRLAKAGHTYGSIFTNRACDVLYRKSKGIPRLINILSHKAMMATYGKGKYIVDQSAMTQAVRDTESVEASPLLQWKGYYLYAVTILMGLVLGAKYYALAIR